MSPNAEFEKTIIKQLARIETLLENQIESNKDHERRLRKIEVECWLTRGAYTVMAAILAWLGYHVNLH